MATHVQRLPMVYLQSASALTLRALPAIAVENCTSDTTPLATWDLALILRASHVTPPP